jgi:hypothetical protein
LAHTGRRLISLLYFGEIILINMILYLKNNI